MKLWIVPGNGRSWLRKKKKSRSNYWKLIKEKRPAIAGLFFYFVPFTRNACITPGIQPKAVNNKLIKNVTPSPCFMNTANGGNRMFKTTVRIDIAFDLFG